MWGEVFYDLPEYDQGYAYAEVCIEELEEGLVSRSNSRKAAEFLRRNNLADSMPIELKRKSNSITQKFSLKVRG